MIELKLKRNHLAVNDVSFNFLFHCLFSKITFLPIALKLVGRKFPVVQNPFQNRNHFNLCGQLHTMK